ncbi:MAG: GntR family transcriptional regulator [Butyrivibrio sp.]|nr:GntR family transcriptional regulator [Butyrivibrio sp.]
MSWNLDADRPIFIQIIEHLQNDIVSGVFKPGEKLPSVRDLASYASVNPNTMQRALSELERTGLVHSERTSGRFITEDINMIGELKTSLATAQIQEFIQKMEKLGLSKEEILNLVQKYTRE